MTDRYAHIVLPHADEPLHPERAEWVHNYILAGCCAGLGKYEWDTIKAALKRLCPGEKTVSDRFRRENPEIECRFPLLEYNLSKADCHAIVRARGIELPMMYRLGFHNNNCIGCPKGGAGYWNQIRIHFPMQFERMCELSRRLGARIVKRGDERIFLDELDPKAGRHKEVEIGCSAFCESAEEALS